MAQKRRGSAKKRVEAKRLQQKRKNRRRLSLSILGFLGLSTLLGFAFLLGGGGGGEAPGASKAPAVAMKKSTPVVKAAKEKRQKEILVAEEYPAEEEKVGFGLEDLIDKTRRPRKKEESKAPKAKAISRGKRPVLVLIIDDVSQARQLQAIRTLPYHITPSIFPPSQINAHSNRLARGLKHYLIHLPLESGSVKMNRFAKTLMVEDGPQKIRHRVREIRKLFPSARFVNNHTGSVFTSNYGAMSHLFGDLKREGFVFVDSRTTGRSVVRKVAADYRAPYIARDVFIDNVQKRGAILAQLKKAVHIAKKRGYAIAIGHPHRATLDALRHAGPVLSGVETLYFDEFYRRYYGR